MLERLQMAIDRRGFFRATFILSVGLAPLAGARLAAQVRTSIEAQAILIGTSLRPTPLKRTIGEFSVVQPILMATIEPIRGLVGRIALDAEGITIDSGEVTAGAWGEGFVDRRHPHTFVHELMIAGTASLGCGRLRCRIGGFGGKGFVPFGSDDPMSRPIAAYPVNHHLAQILERALLGGQIGVGPVVVEAALFNGDEPERPGQWPKVDRFGDSWAGRVTVTPLAGLEVSGSIARVASPEARPGNGPAQRKAHAGLWFDRPVGGMTLGGMAEWARTTELDGVFRFESVLAEGSVTRRDHRFAVRLERTDRPEEERISPFHSIRPHIDNTLVGITRWTLLTAGYRYRGTAGRLAVEPFVEGTVGSIDETVGGLFDVVATYGGSSVRRVSLGIRLAWADGRHRMGRYGMLESRHRAEHHLEEETRP